ncbi:MAG TPA: YwqG family protein [Phycisphaerae bacterium]|nr:YwqG family protein [Phycisphaerae bacterium]
MSFLRRLFGRSKRSTQGERGVEEHLDYLKTLRRPAIALSPSVEKPLSRIGGLPSLPESVPWPEWKGAPLAFLCQVDLSEIPEGFDRHGLPRSGMLYFFYNQEQETWGFDPNDKGSWQVVCTTTPATDNAPRSVPKGLSKDYVYTEKPVALTFVETYPDWQDERVAVLNLSDKQGNEYAYLCSAVFQGRPAHHLFGHPSPVQGNDMDLECQLASHGLYCGDASGYSDQRAKELEPGRREWVLLLQLDSDDDAGMMWGDCGMLYFWIRREDLNERRFANCWMILQCS